jgi:transcriptional regulator with XRE-family HTH domain
LPPEYPREVKTLGDHLRTCRLQRGLLQKDVASLLCVNVNTLVGWEIGRKEPKVSYIPAILEFIGYDPFPEIQNLGERLRAERRRRGLTQHQLANLLGTRQAVVSLLEIGGEVRDERVLAVVFRFVEGEENDSTSSAAP